MKGADWLIVFLILGGIALYLMANKKAKVEIVANTPAPESFEDLLAPGITEDQATAIQGAISEKVPVFDIATSKAATFTIPEIKAMTDLIVARINEGDNRMVLIGTPDASKFVDKAGLLMYRLTFMVYDAKDNAATKLEAVLYNGPGDLGTSIAHLTYAHKPTKDPMLPAEERIADLESPATYETSHAFLKRFVRPTDADSNDVSFLPS